MLRHASARRCTIELTTSRDAVRLQDTNDGVTGKPASQEHRLGYPGGRGLANLAERASALGGRLTTHIEDGHFELTTQLPLPGQASAQTRVED